VNLGTALSLLRRRWLPIFLCLVAGGLGAFSNVARQPKLYVAKASLFINIPAARNTQEQLQGVQLTSQLIKSYAIIATSLTTAQRVKAQLSLPESAGTIAGRISASAKTDTLILVVAALDTDPLRARLIAQTTALELNQVISDLERDRDRSGAVEARVIEDAQTPSHPVSPNPGRSILIGLILGAMAGVAVGLGLDGLDRSVKSSEDAEGLIEAPTLATIPRIRDVPHSATVVADEALSPGAEAYRSLRTAVRFLEPDEPISTLVVTSASAGEGKTTTAANLAIALAQSGERVILVDADLRRAQVAGSMGLVAGVGLSDVILRTASLDEALQEWRDLLLVLPAGSLPPNPAELLGSQRMATVLAELAARCDIVIIDTPPVLPVTDAVVLGAQADATLVVARWGKAQRVLVDDAAKRLRGVGAFVVGSVLNAVPEAKAQDYYEAYRRELAEPAGKR
jgi:capsular exopolysaccharide synthesis family protein